MENPNLTDAEVSYQRKESCNACGADNSLSNCSIDSGVIHEADTKCNSCGFEDHWVHGFFKSRRDGFDKAQGYGNETALSTDPITSYYEDRVDSGLAALSK